MTVDIERVRRVFENDRFATGNGVRILEAAPGHARCGFPAQTQSFHIAEEET